MRDLMHGDLFDRRPSARIWFPVLIFATALASLELLCGWSRAIPIWVVGFAGVLFVATGTADRKSLVGAAEDRTERVGRPPRLAGVHLEHDLY